MAETIRQFDARIEGRDDRSYIPRVSGCMTADGRWEGWIEFDPRDGTPSLRTDRETEQHSWKDLVYWAAGVTPTYLEGAIERARHPWRPIHGASRTAD